MATLTASVHRYGPILGAAIVFITFVIKDELAERWKAQADAVEHARSVYAIRLDIAAVVGQLDSFQRRQEEQQGRERVREGLLVLLGGAKEKKLHSNLDLQNASTSTILELWKLTLSADLARLASTKRSLLIIDDLLRAFPHSQKDESELVEVKAQIGTRTSDYESALKKVRNAIDHRAMGNAVSTEEDLVKGLELKNPTKDDEAVERKADQLFDRVLAAAEGAQRKNERLSVVAWWASLGLYTLGFLVAVAGRISKNPLEGD